MSYKEKTRVIGFVVSLMLALVVPDASALVIPGRPEYEARKLEREREPEAREIRMSYPSRTGNTTHRSTLRYKGSQDLHIEQSISELDPVRPESRTIRYRNPSRSSASRGGIRALRIPGRDYSTAGRSASTYAVASWYGWDFHGRKTASGETYNMHRHTAAHKTLPFGTVVRVTNLRNGRQAIVRINDRGPFVKGRDIDLSYATARDLGMLDSGIERVQLEILSG